LKATAQEQFLASETRTEFKIESVTAAAICATVWPFKFNSLFSAVCENGRRC